MRIAFVYDRVNKIGGAERVLIALNEIWPEAPLYTAVYNPDTARWANRFKVYPSFLQHIPGARTHHEWLAPLTPMAFEAFDFRQFDVVISLTSAEAKGIITGPQTLHICYCLTPTRYLWSGKSIYEKRGGRSWGLKILGSYLRQWDFVAAQRPDVMVAISQAVQERIRKYYAREAKLIYPPVDVKKFSQKIPKSKKQTSPFYLLVSRLVSYKRVDLAIQAFNDLSKKLVIIGEGEEQSRLRKLAKKNIRFVGRLTDKELVRYYQSCRAVIFPGEEDFGLVAIEAQAAGKPVIGYRHGGLTETVVHGKTGWLFSEPSSQALAQAVTSFENRKWSPALCQQQAKKFAKRKFQKTFQSFVEVQWQKHQQHI